MNGRLRVEMNKVKYKKSYFDKGIQNSIFDIENLNYKSNLDHKEVKKILYIYVEKTVQASNLFLMRNLTYYQIDPLKSQTKSHASKNE